MVTSIIFAQILGLYMAIMALAMFIRPQVFLNVIKEFKTESALVIFSIALGLLTGIIIIVFHNLWVAGWPLVITLLGWFSLLRSVIYLFFPEVLPKIVNLFNVRSVYISATIMGIIGLFLIYHGFLLKV